MKPDSADIVVVGSGIAGLSAAITAMQAGASVIQLERSPEHDRGGNTRWTEALLRMKSDSEVADDFEDAFANNAGYHLDPSLIQETAGDFENRSAIAKSLAFTDPDVIAAFADRAPATLQWLKTFGVRFDFQPTYLITTSTTRLSPVGGGLALVEALSAAGNEHGLDVRFETTATKLVHDESGAVTGVRVVGKHNQHATIHARSVILACGGFEGNPEMLTRYLGPDASHLRPVARGGYYNKGEGIRMALDAGAAPCGDYGLIHAEPLDPRSGAPEPIVLIFNYGILVNRNGHRFVDEAPATVDATYEAITREIYKQPGAIAYTIFDAQIDDVPNWQRAVRSDVAPFTANSLPELAAMIGVPEQALVQTIESFNAACPAAGSFDPLQTDGLATTNGLQPLKSNWSRPINRPPYQAFPLMCGNCFTFGGIKVDPNAQVLNADGEPMPGLYAAGETMGIYYGAYTGSTSVLRGAVFGRIAGEQAAQRSSR